MTTATQTRTCPTCNGRKFVPVYYGGIETRGQRVCPKCKGAATVERPVSRIVSEGPEVD